MTVISVPTYSVVGQEVALDMNAATGTEFAFNVTSRPANSKQPLGLLTDQHLLSGVRLGSASDDAGEYGVPPETANDARLTFQGNGPHPGTITRTQGSFVDEGFKAGQGIDVSASVSNDQHYTIAAVTDLTITLTAAATLTAESGVAATITATSLQRSLGASEAVNFVVKAGRSALRRSFVPDKPGEYTVTGYDIREVYGVPAFAGDPSGVSRFELLGSQSSIIHVGAFTELPLLTATGEGATLRLQVNENTIRAAYLVNPTSERARTSALATEAGATFLSLTGQTITAVGTDLQTGVDDLLTEYEAHRISTAGGVHVVADSVNVAGRDTSDSVDGAIGLLNVLRDTILSHAQTTPAASVWHGVGVEDWKNTPLAGPATDLASATVLSADLRERVYERHRVLIASPASHGAADNTNTLTAPSILDSVIVAFFDLLASENVAVIAGEPEGINDAESRYGFRLDE